MIKCRICLSCSTEMDISQLKSYVDDTSKTCVDIFNFCLNIKIEEDTDKLTKLCSSCFYKVLSFYEFKCLALKSDAYLKKTPQLFSEYELKKSPCSDNVKLEDIDFNDIDYLVEVEVTSTTVKNEESDGDNGIPDSLADEMIIVVPPKNKSKAKPKKTTRVRKKIQTKSEPTTTTRATKSGPKKVFYSDRKVLNLHTQKQHEKRLNQKTYECNDCGKRFFSYNVMNYHYKTEHSGLNYSAESPYVCKICWRRFDAKANLDSHILSHSQPHVCELCGKSYSTKYRLKVHHQQHHEKIKRFCCQHCPKKYYTRDSLSYHINAHHVINDQSYECPDCGKSFKLWKSFKIHLRSHRTTKAYVCTVCVDRAFKTQGILYAHMLTHQERRHVCQHCGSKFTRKAHLDKHIKAKHSGDTAKTKKRTTKDEV